MSDVAHERMRHVWNRREIPVLLRRPGKPLRMRLPYRQDNRAWIHGEHCLQPTWEEGGRYWEVPKSWFNMLVARCLETFGRTYIIQPYREQEKCAPACWNAKGDECQCSCMGENHGSQSPAGRWKVISETFATRWHDEELACWLVTRRT